MTIRIKDSTTYQDGKQNVDIALASTDTKPTDVATGSTCVETDTGKHYVFDEDSGDWTEEQTSGGGGGGGGTSWTTIFNESVTTELDGGGTYSKVITQEFWKYPLLRITIDNDVYICPAQVGDNGVNVAPNDYWDIELGPTDSAFIIDSWDDSFNPTAETYFIPLDQSGPITVPLKVETISLS